MTPTQTDPRVIELKGGPYDGATITLPYGPVRIALEDEFYYKVNRGKNGQRVWVHSSIWGRAQ